MAVTLTPDQQAKLDQFETDAQAASEAEATAEQSASDLLTLTHQNSVNQQAAIDDLSAALESGRAFIDSMIPKPPTKTP